MLSRGSSGDAQLVARRLGIEECFVCLPHEKVQHVEALQKEGGGGKVVMVGDGVNDAPALATADVEYQTQTSDGANVVFLNNSLEQLPHLLVLGQKWGCRGG
jgi:P-type E1-E2 ATPase